MPNPTYATVVKTARMTATRDEVAAGDLQLLTAADAVLATFSLSAAGGTVATDTWTLQFDAGSGSSTVAASAAGTAAKAKLRDSLGNDRITGLSVGTGGSVAVTIDNAVIESGQSITVTSATLQHAPDPV